MKVCDICGDAGREELLAICSKCIDGAEHMYMTILLYFVFPLNYDHLRIKSICFDLSCIPLLNNLIFYSVNQLLYARETGQSS